MPTKKSTGAPETLQIPTIEMVSETIYLIGCTGLYCHRMSQKAARELLLGGRKKTAAERATIKHHPRDEFRRSMYVHPEAHDDAVVSMPAMAFKRAMRTVAAELAGIKGTQVDRLVFVEDEFVPIFGTPLLRMDITRSSDIARTPDVRTRSYFPQWGTVLRIRRAIPAVSRTALYSLISNAGTLIGVGDNRQERGKGNFGTFQRCKEADLKALRAGGKAAQVQAIEDCEPDQGHGDTATLLEFYDEELLKRA